MTEYIYLLQEREFIKTNENIYKIGMTKKENLGRFNQYPKGSILLFQMICNDCKNSETQLISIFKDKYIQRKDIGTEYFEGNYRNMIDTIYINLKNNNCDNNEFTPLAENEVLQKPNDEYKLLKEKYMNETWDLIVKYADKLNYKLQNSSEALINNKYKLWFDENIEISQNERLSQEKIIELSGFDSNYIRNQMSCLGFKYCKDLGKLGKNINGNYYKGGYINCKIRDDKNKLCITNKNKLCITNNDTLITAIKRHYNITLDDNDVLTVHSIKSLLVDYDSKNIEHELNSMNIMKKKYKKKDNPDLRDKWCYFGIKIIET